MRYWFTSVRFPGTPSVTSMINWLHDVSAPHPRVSLYVLSRLKALVNASVRLASPSVLTFAIAFLKVYTFSGVAWISMSLKQGTTSYVTFV